jgi:hypothetical protein
MNVGWTVLSGLGLLVLGQIIIRSFIDPVYELRKLRGEIADALLFYAHLYMNPGHAHKTAEIDAAVHALRSLGTRLEATHHAVPLYGLFALLRAVPPEKSIKLARGNLVGLGNSIYIGNLSDNEKRRDEIIEALKLRITDA